LADGTLVVDDSSFSGNSAGEGGGIEVGTGTGVVSGSIFSGNSATGAGGGLLCEVPATLAVSDSTVSGNSAIGSGFVNGGGVAGGGGIFNNGSLTVSNCTVTNNITNGLGGGIYDFGDLTVHQTTITGNQAIATVGGPGQGGGLYIYYLGKACIDTLTIISGNVASTAGNDVYGSYTICPSGAPDIVVNSATTKDSKSVSVDYEIENAGVTQPLEFDIYRSASPTGYNQRDFVASKILDPASDPQDLTIGDHPDVRLDLGGAQLTIDPSHPYVIVVANPNHTILEADQANDTNDMTAFRKYVLGVVTHGLIPSIGGISLPFTDPSKWMEPMNGSLLADGYDDVIPFYWISQSATSQPGEAIAAGNLLYQQIISVARQLVTKPDPLTSNGQPLAGSVVDLHLIGHSRGSVVISQAMQDLQGTTIPELEGGYKRMTMLDPHPASNSISLFLMSFDPTSVLGWLAATEVILFQSDADDPEVVVPANVDQAEVYFQHTNHSDTPSLSEQILNLWGEDSVSTGAFTGSFHPCNLTAPGIGHSEVHDWYQLNVVNRNLVDNWPPFCPGDPPSSASQSSSDINLLYPKFVDNQGVAQSLIDELASAKAAYERGNIATTINILGAFVNHVEAQSGKHITADASNLLISLAQLLAQELGSTPGQSVGTVAAMRAGASVSLGSIGPSAGALLAADLYSYINHANGYFGADALARMQDTNASDAKQAALNAVLADWLTGTDLTGKLGGDVDNGHWALNRLGAASLNDSGDFWSTIAAGMAMDKITDLSSHFGR
jgi:hypothetical protein